MDKMRTTPFQPQSNVAIERTNKILQKILAKCVYGEHSNRSPYLLYVKLAYRSSVHESTGYTPRFLVFEQELRLLLDCMYPNSLEKEAINLHVLVYYKEKQTFQRALELVRRNLNKK